MRATSDDFKLANKVRINKHVKRKNHDKVAAMYAMYCLPRSLRYVAKEYRITSQAVHGMFKTRGYEMRSKQLRGLQELDGIKFTFMKSKYLRGTVGKDRMLMHHYVWQKANGPIPPGYCIYHLDKNPENNSLENLALLDKKKMSATFNPKHNNQFTKNETA